MIICVGLLFFFEVGFGKAASEYILTSYRDLRELGLHSAAPRAV